MNKKQLIAVPSLMLVAALGFSTMASASTFGAQVGVGTANEQAHISTELKMRGQSDMAHENEGTHNIVFGTVSAINGSTITISSLSMDKEAKTQTSTTYVVNASAATVDKNSIASTIAGILVGDRVAVQGTVTGTNIVATKIHDGVMVKGTGRQTPATPGMDIPEGNGQPIIGGTVTGISGNTITITNKSNVTYTINATSAKVTKGNTAATVSSVTVGDSIVAQGTVNGTSITAVNIVDSGLVSSTSGATHNGFFGAIGGFFSRLFGFGK